jgi:phosphatidylethanolamine N-methyltransferase
LTDIERAYGQRKLLAQRKPLIMAAPTLTPAATPVAHTRLVSDSSTSLVDVSGLRTPSSTDGDTGTESDLVETDTETESEVPVSQPLSTPKIKSAPLRPVSLTPPNASGSSRTSKRHSRSPMLSQHDLMNRFFHKDVIALANFDALRYVCCFGCP